MKNIREYIKRCCIILVYLSIFISCSKRDESNYNLYFDYRNSIVINKDFPFKNLMIHNYVDSIVLLKKYDESFILKYKHKYRQRKGRKTEEDVGGGRCVHVFHC